MNFSLYSISKHLMRTLATVLLLMVALNGAAHAATRTFALPHYLANPGGIVEVPLTLDNASGLAAIRIQINYDPAVLKLLSVSAGPLGNAFEFSPGKGDGYVRLLLIRSGSLATGSGRLATLKFRANPGAKANAYSDLAIADVGLSDSSGVINLRQKDTLRLTNGQVAVTLSTNINNTNSGPNESWKELKPLSGLSLNNGKLTTPFSPSVLNYTASVPETVKTLKIKPTLADPNATVKVNGAAVTSGSFSSAIPLAVGINTIAVRVSSENGNRFKTYKINVTRRESSDATLAALVVNSATLTPKFSKQTTSYTTALPATTKSLRIKPTASHSAATIAINGISAQSGTLCAPIPLNTGKNVFKVVVTAQNGNTKTYKIVATRAQAAPATSESLATAMALFPTTSLIPYPEEIQINKVIIDGQTYLQLTTRSTSGAPKPIIEVSPNLLDWYSGDNHTTTLIDDARILKVRDNTPITPEAKRYIRVH